MARQASLTSGPRSIGPRRFTVLGCLFALLVFCAPASAQSLVTPEAEPNNTAAAADSSVVQITGDGTISGSINPAGDTDYFRITVGGAGTKELTLETRDGTGSGCAAPTATWVRLFDAGGAQIATDLTAGINNCSLLTRRVAPGTYYVAVAASSFSATISSYQLLTTFRTPPACGDGLDSDGDTKVDYPSDPGCDSLTDTTEDSPDAADGRIPEEEPNGTKADADARSIRITGTHLIAGAIEVQSDLDWYRIELTEARDVELETRDSTGTGCASPTATNLLLINSAGTTIIDRDSDGGINSCSLLRRTLPAGTYYVRVGERGAGTVPGYRLLTALNPPLACGDTADNDGDATVDFPADAGCDGPRDTTESPDATDGRIPEQEPNNSRADADARSLRITGSALIAAGIDSSSDKDFFRIDIPSRKDVLLENRHGTETGCLNAQMRLRLFNAAGTEITNDYASGGNACSRISRRLSGGTYYVSAEEVNNSDTIDTYRLLVTMTAPQQCDDELDNDLDATNDYPADIGCDSPTDNSESPDATDGRVPEIEANNTRADADARPIRITSDALIAGGLTQGDLDFFRVDVTERREIQLQTRDGGTTCNVATPKVWNSAGASLGLTTSSPSGSCQISSRTIEPGTYYVSVERQLAEIPAYRLAIAFRTVPECDDAADNDSDAKTDYPADLGCDSLTDTTEGADATDGRIPEEEPNNTRAEADARSIRILGSQVIAGAVQTAGDQDWYRVELTETRDLELETRDSTGTGCASPTGTVVYLFNAAGTAIIDRDAGGGIGLCSLLRRTLPAGTYYVRLSATSSAVIPGYRLLTAVNPPIQCSDGSDNDGDGNVDFPADSGCDGPRDAGESPDAADGRVPEQESNNTRAEADARSLRITGNSVIAAAIDPGSDKDFFRIDLAGDRLKEIRLENRHGTEPDCFNAQMRLRLFDAAGAELVNDFAGGAGACSRVVRRVSPGTYYVSAEEVNGSDTVGTYRLLSTVTDVPRCEDGTDDDGDSKTDYPADVGCDSPTDDSESPDATDGRVAEAEPNGGPISADARSLRITGDTLIAGQVTAIGDLDYFRVDVPSTRQVEFAMRSADGGCPPGPHQLSLYNSAGSFIQSANGGPSCPTLRRGLTAGTYYIAVISLSTPIPAYRLSTTFIKQCADGVDNDADTTVDFPADRGCESATDDSESPDPPLDVTAPGASHAVDPDANGAGWHRQDVTVALSADDEEGGSGVDEIIWSAVGAAPSSETIVSGASASIPVNAEGITTITYRARDNAGNLSAPATAIVRLDKTSPTADCEDPDGGWHAGNQSFDCAASDAGSGLESSGDAAFTLATDVAAGSENAAASTGSRSVCDAAGNCAATGPVGPVRVDRRAPATDCESPDTDWQAGNQSFDCTGSDGGSGLASPGDAAFTLSTAVGAGEEDASAQTGSRQVCDATGNCVTAGPVGPVKVDRRAPSTSCEQPDSGWHASNRSFACTAADGGSGLESSGDAAFSLATSVGEGAEDASAQTGSRGVCDTVGNCATAGPLGPIKVDRKAPALTCEQPDSEWHTANLLFDCAAVDGGSGLANAGNASFQLGTSVVDGQVSESAFTGERQVCDAAANCATAGPLGPSKVDRRPPAPPPSDTETESETGSPPGGDVTPPDLTPPAVTLSGARRQRVLRQRGLVVTAVASENGSVSAAATVNVPKLSKVYRLQAAVVPVVAGQKVVLKLVASKKALAAIRRALAAGRRLRATVTVTTTDGAGNAQTAQRGIKLAR